jgi:HAD superfamily hydrolase (TIGR01509 family)
MNRTDLPLQLKRYKPSGATLEQGADGGRLYPVGESLPPTSTPTALLLAGENVLYDATVWDRWLVRLLRHVGVPIDQESFTRRWIDGYLGDIHCGRIGFVAAFRKCLQTWGLSDGLIDEVTAASQGRRHQFLRETRPLPNIRQTLLALSQRSVALGLMVDTELSVADLERHLTRLGFGGRFSFVLSSVELGYTKAEESAYRVAMARFGKPPERIAFVGNRAEHLSAAARLGMPTVAFNYDDHARADLYLRQFDELVSMFANWPLAS